MFGIKKKKEYWVRCEMATNEIFETFDTEEERDEYVEMIKSKIKNRETIKDGKCFVNCSAIENIYFGD